MRFYVMEKPKVASSEDTFCGIDIEKSEGTMRGDAPTCARCGAALGFLIWLPPYKIELKTWGKKYADIGRTGDDLVVSERFVEVFQCNALRGLGFHPVEVVKLRHKRGKPDEGLPRYFQARVPQGATTVNQQASGYEWLEGEAICPNCLGPTPRRYARTILKPETWDGLDIFFPRGSSELIVTEQFKMAFESAGLRGAVFRNPEDVGYDSFPWDKEENVGKQVHPPVGE